MQDNLRMHITGQALDELCVGLELQDVFNRDRGVLKQGGQVGESEGEGEGA